MKAWNYKSTMAVLELDYILADAIKTDTDKPKSKRQEKFVEMLIMHAKTTVFHPYFDTIKTAQQQNPVFRHRFWIT